MSELSSLPLLAFGRCKSMSGPACSFYAVLSFSGNRLITLLDAIVSSASLRWMNMNGKQSVKLLTG